MPFHRHCGDRITLLNDNLTAARNYIDFTHGVVLSSEPLINDVAFEVRIDKMVDSWNGTVEIGVTAQQPETMDLSTTTRVSNVSWLLCGNLVIRNGVAIRNNYGTGLNAVTQGDNIGVMRTSKGELKFYMNGECFGIADQDMPELLHAVINLYGKCVQVTIIEPGFRTSSPGALTLSVRPSLPALPSNLMQLPLSADTDTSADRVPEDATVNDNTTVSTEVETVTIAGDTPESKGPEEVRLDLAVELIKEPIPNRDKLRFHSRCGILVTLSNNNRTAERARPLDDYNNGVVMTHRPLTDDELFEIRIERLIDKWSGSIEVGVTTHNPATLRFPNTMTNMETGTIMMSGCKDSAKGSHRPAEIVDVAGSQESIHTSPHLARRARGIQLVEPLGHPGWTVQNHILINGHATGTEYGYSNLDELKEGDTVGMMRTSSGKLHYFINGVDQGVAFHDIEEQIWGVVDLYGMTVKVTIIEGVTEIDHLQSGAMAENNVDRTLASQLRPRLDEDSLLFHTLRDSDVVVINDGKTAHRPNAHEYFHNGVVMTNRTLKTNELFQVRLDVVIPKWAGSIEIGVTQHLCNEIIFPFKMSNAKSGTWAMTGEDVIRDGSVIIPQYVRDLTKLVEGDTVGVMRKEMGILHFFVNGVDQGMAAFNVPEHVFGIIDLYGKVAQATIVDSHVAPAITSLDSQESSVSNGTIYPELCFHRVHGHNVILKRSRLMAKRRNNCCEFSDAVLFSSRPLRECEMFELRIEQTVHCWLGSLEIGVTAIKPEELESAVEEEQPPSLTGTAGDLSWNTYILSGSNIFKDGELVLSNYNLDLDKLVVGSRIGLMWHSDRSLHYYLDGLDQGRAFDVPHLNIYAVVDIYGQCAQVSIVQGEERGSNYACTSDNSTMANLKTFSETPKPYCFSEYCGETMWMSQDYKVAVRRSMEPTGGLVFSSGHLRLGEPFQVNIVRCRSPYHGSLRIGLTDIDILNAHVNRSLPSNLTLLPNFITYIDGDRLMRSTPGEKEHNCVARVRPSFAYLSAGDTVALLKTNNNTVRVYLNSRQIDVAFENVPDKVFLAAELYGSCTVVKAVAKAPSAAKIVEQPIYQCAATPPPSEEPIPSTSRQTEPVSTADPTTVEAPSPVPNENTDANPRPFTFHTACGSNLRLLSSDTVAVRRYGYNNGIAIVAFPLQKGKACYFRIDKMSSDWFGNFMIGAILKLPTDELPECATHLNMKCWIIDHQVMNYNGNLVPTDIAQALQTVEEETILGLHFTDNYYLNLHIDNVLCCTLAVLTKDITEVYPLIDIYGQCTQVSLLLYPYKIQHSISALLDTYDLKKIDNCDDIGMTEISGAIDEDDAVNGEIEDGGEVEEEDESDNQEDDVDIIEEDFDDYGIGEIKLSNQTIEIINEEEDLVDLVAVDMGEEFDENLGQEVNDVVVLESLTDNNNENDNDDDEDDDIYHQPVDEDNEVDDQEDELEIFDGLCGRVFERLSVSKIPNETEEISMETSDEFPNVVNAANVNDEEVVENEDEIVDNEDELVENESSSDEAAGDLISEKDPELGLSERLLYVFPNEFTDEQADETVYELPDEFVEDYVDENDYEEADDIVNKVAENLNMYVSDIMADETSDSIADEIIDEVADEIDSIDQIGLYEEFDSESNNLADEILDLVAEEVNDEVLDELIGIIAGEEISNDGYGFGDDDNEMGSEIVEESEEADDDLADDQSYQGADDENEQTSDDQTGQGADDHNGHGAHNQNDKNSETACNATEGMGGDGDKDHYQDRLDKATKPIDDTAKDKTEISEDEEDDRQRVDDKACEAEPDRIDKLTNVISDISIEGNKTLTKKEDVVVTEEEGDKIGVDVDDEDSDEILDNLVVTGTINNPPPEDWMQEEAGALIFPRPGPSTSNDDQQLLQVLTQSVLGAEHRRTSLTPNDVYNRQLQRSKSNHSFRNELPEKEHPCNDRPSARRSFDVNQRPIVLRETDHGYEDITDIVHRDPNVRHNALYPEQNGREDSLDSDDIINALSNMESNNWPDLNDERSSSGYEATNASESFGHHDMELTHYVNSNFGYLKNLIFCDDEPQNRIEYDGDDNREAVGRCEYLHTVLKYWQDLVPHFPENRQSIMWGHIECHCQHCDPTAPPRMAGWVRIRRDLPPPNPRTRSERVYWNVDGSLLRWVLLSDAATLMHASTGRPSCLQIIPSSAPYFSTLWFDEEHKPLRASIAIEIDKNYDENGIQVEPKDDRMIALLLRLEPPVPNLEEDIPTMLPDDDFYDFE